MKMDDNRPLALRVRNVSKQYRLGEIGGKTLQHELQSWWARKRGLPDPNTVIGQENVRIGEKFFALRDVNLEVREGETLGIIGRNGAGKSTLLKLLCRVTAPTTGVIDLYGRITSMLEVGTGFNGEMTGRENVYMNGAILGMTRAEVDEKMDQIIAFSEVGEFIDTPVKRYSSGMYVKLGFSVAMHLNSEILVMDEVLAVGDVLFQNKCIEKMQEAARDQGKTVLYVSHNMSTVRRLCSRCIVLDHGRIVYDGDTESAIPVYMQMNQELKRRLEVDYTKGAHPRWPKDPSILLQKAAFLHKTENSFSSREKLRLYLSWKNVKDTPSAGLRIEFRTLDDVPQGTYFLDDIWSGKAGTSAEAEFELDISALAPAGYQMIYTFFRRDGYGNNEDLECRWGLCLYVKESPAAIVWDTRNWGYHLMRGAELKRLKVTGEEEQHAGSQSDSASL